MTLTQIIVARFNLEHSVPMIDFIKKTYSDVTVARKKNNDKKHHWWIIDDQGGNRKYMGSQTNKGKNVKDGVARN